MMGPSRLLAATVVATQGDAVVSRDEVAGSWTIGNAAIAVTYGFATGRELVLQQIVDPRTSQRWPITDGPDVSLILQGAQIKLSEANAGLRLSEMSADTWNGGVRLMFVYSQSDLGAAIRRFYVCYPGAPVIEAWTRIDVVGASDPISIGGMTAWDLTVSGATARWVNGIRGDNPDTPNDEAFTRVSRVLASGEDMALGSDRRSSEQYLPFVMIDGPSGEFFGGSMWSGSWQIALTRRDQSLHVTLAYPGVTTKVAGGQSLELPHGFFGVAQGTADNVPAALRPFIDVGIRQGRPLAPLVTYNTWFAHGTQIDETSMAREIDSTANLGVELFVLDAGWYVGAGAGGDFDFESGLGSWQVDSDRFPHGLRALRDLTQSRGMRFGLWVEPERVSLDTVGRPGLAPEGWLATRDGSYGSTTTAQICLGTAAGRAWVQQQLFALLDDVQPDYLKWDNNFWLNCNRSGHDHGAEDGNFAHVQGLYALLHALRDRYPDMLVEDSAGGGSRLDFGWLRYSDVAWMDDRTAPSAAVRHNLEGVTAVFPPSYLLSFVIDHEEESIFDGADVPLYLRSRWPGILGMTCKTPTLPDSLFTNLGVAIQTYQAIREIVANANAELLTTQMVGSGHPGGLRWDAIQELDPNSGNAVVFAYQSDQGSARFTVMPRGLRPDGAYNVSSVDAGVLGSAQGGALMRDGIEIVQGAESSRAHVLILTVKQ